VRAVWALVLLGACARANARLPDGEQQPDATGPAADAAAGEVDAGAPPDSAPQPPPGGGGGATQLLLTEIALAPTGGEFVEIANPTNQAVDLATFYLADNGKYFQLPAGTVAIDTNDWIVRFPAGASIPAHGVVTVATDSAANFMTTYGMPPTYAIVGGTLTTVAINGVATLTNAGEIVVLFQWDGQSDLVHDVDMMIAGVPTAANGLIDKSGMALDGPDAGATTTAYAADAHALAAQPTAAASGKSTKRIALETGHETQSGTGNGAGGDDETSENTAVTWDTAYTAPTPGAVPTVLLP